MKFKITFVALTLAVFYIFWIKAEKLGFAQSSVSQATVAEKQKIFMEMASPATTLRQQGVLMGTACRAGFLDDVVAEYGKLVQQQPNNPILLSAYGEAFAYRHDVQLHQNGNQWRQQDYLVAQNAVEKAVQGEGKSMASCWAIFGYFYSATNTNLLKAREGYRHAVLLDPNNAVTHNNLAKTYIVPGKNCNPLEALRQVHIAIQLNKNLANAYDTEAYAYMDLNNNKAAYEAWKKYASFFKPNQISPVTQKLLDGLRKLAGK